MATTACPSCNAIMGTAIPAALSRRDNKSSVCSPCGRREAMWQMLVATQLPEFGNTYFIETTDEILRQIHPH